MSDIVERLRALEAWIRKPTGEAFNMNTDLFDDAADEIERLRAALEEIASGKYSGIMLMSHPPQDPAVNRARAALEGRE